MSLTEKLSTDLFSTNLFTAELVITLRRLLRDKVFVGINVLGLTIAFTCALVLWPYALKQLSYDQHYRQHERIVRIVYDYELNGSSFITAETSFALGILLSQHYPQIGDYTRISWRDRTVFRHKDKSAYWTDVYIANDNYFDLFNHDSFDHEILYGNPKTALSDPYSIAISESFARTYFGDANPLGLTLSDDNYDHHVTLVFADQPDNTHIKFSALTSFNLSKQRNPSFFANLAPQWVFGMGGHTFFRLNPDISQDYLYQLLDEFYEDQLREYGEETNQSIRFIVQPLSKIHFGSGFQNDRPTSNIYAIYGLLIITTLLLLIAAINYINLSTARAAKNAKSIAVRKTLGASNQQLAWGFIVEGIILCLFALGLAILGTEIFSVLTVNKENIKNNITGTTLAIILTTAYAFLISLYPAYKHSGYSLVQHTMAKKRSIVNIRSLLIFLQLFASVLVLGITMPMLKQLNYISNKDIGFKTQDQIIIPIHTADVIEKIPLMKQALNKLSNIQGVTSTNYLPGGRVFTLFEKLETNSGEMKATETKQFFVDNDFFTTMEIEIVDGSGLSSDKASGVLSPIVVNEALVKEMDWNAPLGKRMEVYDRGESRVAGVVRDYHFWSLHQPIKPLRLVPFKDNEFENIEERQRKNAIRFLIINIVPDQTGSALPQIEAIMKELDPQHPFEYHLLQDLIDQFYQSERLQAQFTIVFTVVSLLITALGLLAFVAFTCEQQSKAIGIRKVLGASRGQLFNHFLVPILASLGLASVMAVAVAYYSIQYWLSDFSYRAPQSFSIYLFSVLFVAVLVCLTVSWQILKTTAANPVGALRNE